jgi:hypothetical protein
MVSFLNQLKSQADAIQAKSREHQTEKDLCTELTEGAALTTWLYLAELVKQLNVIQPDGPELTLDGKTPWPRMKMVNFHIDSRKKILRDKEVFDYIAVSWQIVPHEGEKLSGSVSANFPPEMKRIEDRLFFGFVKHEKVDVRDPEKNTLKEFRFDYKTQARAGVTVTANHDESRLDFRLSNLQGFQITTPSYAASEIQAPLLDELAKLILGQASRFV